MAKIARVVSNVTEAIRILKYYMQVKEVTIDTETTGEELNGIKYSALILNRARLLTFQMCAPKEPRYVFVSDSQGASFLDFSKILPYVKRVLESRDILKKYHGANYDINVFLNYGINSVNNYCTLIAGACFNENLGNSLKERAVLVGKLLKKTRTVDFSSIPDLVEYGAEDIDATEGLHEYYSGGKTIKIVARKSSCDVQLSRLRGARKLFYEKQEIPFLNLIIKAERRGVRIDLKKLSGIDAQIKKDSSAILKRIYAHAKGPFNVGSRPQLAEVLFNKLGITPPEDCLTSKGAPSTNARALFYMHGSHPIVDDVLAYRKLSKLREVYTNPESGLSYFCDSDGYIHASVNGVGAKTFRCSYAHPNLQTIPSKRDVYGIRACFIAPWGRKLAVYDYSQIEVRMQAIRSQDPIMVAELCKRLGDIYLRTGKEFGSEDPKSERSMFKIIVLALQYGMGPWTLSDNLIQEGYQVNKTEARKWIRKYFDIYAGIPKMWDSLFKEHVKNGFVTTLLGRPRAIPHFDTAFQYGSGKLGLNVHERMLVNNWMQGSTGDWVKQGMLRVEGSKAVTKYGYQQDLQVHDEVFGTVPEKDADEIFAEVMGIVEQPPESPFAPVYPVIVPIRVEGAIGDTWKECKAAM